MSASSVTATATGQTQAIPLDLTRFRYGNGIIVTVSAGTTATWSVMVTGDTPIPSGAFVNWNQHDLLQSVTGSANGNIVYPVTAIALNVTAISGGGYVNMALVQAED